MRTSSILSWGAGTSVSIYFVCLMLPALDLREVFDQVHTLYGINLALTGAAGVFGGNFAWLANGALLVAWALAFSDKPTPCLYSSMLAFILSLHTFRFNYNHIADKSTSCCLLIQNFQSGFYFWLTSILIMLIMAWMATIEKRLTSKAPPSRAQNGDAP
jgi:hypothetical protein